MDALLPAEMAVWVPEDAAGPAPAAPQHERALAALDRQGLRLSGIVLAVAVLSALAAGVMSAFATL